MKSSTREKLLTRQDRRLVSLRPTKVFIRPRLLSDRGYCPVKFISQQCYCPTKIAVWKTSVQPKLLSDQDRCLGKISARRRLVSVGLLFEKYFCLTKVAVWRNISVSSKIAIVNLLDPGELLCDNPLQPEFST